MAGGRVDGEARLTNALALLPSGTVQAALWNSKPSSLVLGRARRRRQAGSKGTRSLTQSAVPPLGKWRQGRPYNALARACGLGLTPRSILASGAAYTSYSRGELPSTQFETGGEVDAACRNGLEIF